MLATMSTTPLEVAVTPPGKLAVRWFMIGRTMTRLFQEVLQVQSVYDTDTRYRYRYMIDIKTMTPAIGDLAK